MPRTILSVLAAALLSPALASAQPLVAGTITSLPSSSESAFYGFSFQILTTPRSYSSATLTGTLTLTADAGTGASVALSALAPTFLQGYGRVGASSTLLAELGTASCTVAPGSGSPTLTCPLAPLTVTFAPTFFDGIELRLAYDQLGSGSLAVWNASFALGDEVGSVVPEPATLALLAPALLAVGAVARRRVSPPMA